jgi:hypothetical protein
MELWKKSSKLDNLNSPSASRLDKFLFVVDFINGSGQPRRYDYSDFVGITEMTNPDLKDIC